MKELRRIKSNFEALLKHHLVTATIRTLKLLWNTNRWNTWKNFEEFKENLKLFLKHHQVASNWKNPGTCLKHKQVEYMKQLQRILKNETFFETPVSGSNDKNPETCLKHEQVEYMKELWRIKSNFEAFFLKHHQVVATKRTMKFVWNTNKWSTWNSFKEF